MKSAFEAKAVRSEGAKGAAALLDGCQSLCMSKNTLIEVELIEYEAHTSHTRTNWLKVLLSFGISHNLEFISR